MNKVDNQRQLLQGVRPSCPANHSEDLMPYISVLHLSFPVLSTSIGWCRAACAGPIPESLGDLTELKKLVLSNNGLSGERSSDHTG